MQRDHAQQDHRIVRLNTSNRLHRPGTTSHHRTRPDLRQSARCRKRSPAKQPRATSDTLRPCEEECDSTRESPLSSSCRSMHSNREELTPDADSSQNDTSVSMPAAAKLSELHINAKSPRPRIPRQQQLRGDLRTSAANKPLASTCCKRTDSSWEDQFISEGPRCSSPDGDLQPCHKYRRRESWQCQTPQAAPPNVASNLELCKKHADASGPIRHDSLLDTKDSNCPIKDHQDSMADPRSELISQDSLHLRGKDRWPGMALQPEFSPISQQQLATEVKGIYGGLVMVESKCMSIDSQKSKSPEEPLSAEQWQALVALHRTLLYEHHDFLMATQHPSANSALLGLAAKYSMPARMWKHGIHSFLEVLRHRRPASQEYMLAFICLAYQMISLLLETVPSFTDTWIECLGDLARYRMAIEEDKEIHTIWGGVAARWYTMAADRHPYVGRLYHHAGILERPSLRKFYFYARALTSVVPFPNAKESLGTLCAPVLNDKQSVSDCRSAEAMVIFFHAKVFDSQDPRSIGLCGDTAVKLLDQQPTSKIAPIGVSLAVTNIAALFDFGYSENIYRQLFDIALDCDFQKPCLGPKCDSAISLTGQSCLKNLVEAHHPSKAVHEFCYNTFNSIIRRETSRESFPDVLPFLHAMLVFLHSMSTLQSRLGSNELVKHTLGSLFDFQELDWVALSRFLNLLAVYYPITAHVESFADSGTFLEDGASLHEDFLIRGLVWAQWYFSPTCFDNIEDDDGSRRLEDDDKKKKRAARVLYLGMLLAHKSDFLLYDREVRRFSSFQTPDSKNTDLVLRSWDTKALPSSRESSAERGFVMITESPATTPSSAYDKSTGSKKVGGSKKSCRPSSASEFGSKQWGNVAVNVVGDDHMAWD